MPDGRILTTTSSARPAKWRSLVELIEEAQQGGSIMRGSSVRRVTEAEAPAAKPDDAES